MAREKKQTSSIKLTSRPIKIFTGSSHPILFQQVSTQLGIPLGKLITQHFADGEFHISIEEPVIEQNIYMMQSTCAPANDTLMELLIVLDAFRRSSSKQINVIIPYLGYSRQDKKHTYQGPITAKLISNLIVQAGANSLAIIDLHTEQIQGFLDIPLYHLSAIPIIGQWMKQQNYQNENIVVISPDGSGVKRATILAEMLKAPLAVVTKRRQKPNQIQVIEVIGEVKGKKCIIIDDIIDTGETILQATKALIELGADQVIASCIHPVFSQNTLEKLQGSMLTKIVSMDTIPIPNAKQYSKLKIISWRSAYSRIY